MIGWIIGIVTLILLLFLFWRRASEAFRERAETPKYLFLESLGVRSPHAQSQAQTHTSQEDKDDTAHP